MLHSQPAPSTTPHEKMQERPLRVTFLGNSEKTCALRKHLEHCEPWKVTVADLDSGAIKADMLNAADVFIVQAGGGAVRSLLTALDGQKSDCPLPAVLVETDHALPDVIPEGLKEALIFQVIPPQLDAATLKRQVSQLAQLRDARHRLARAEETAEKARVDALQILRIVAHDLRGPIQSLRVFPQMMRLQFAKVLGERGGEAVQDMESDISRLHAGIEDLLHWSMVQLENPVEECSPVSIRQIGEEAIWFATQIIDKEHQIHNDLPDDLELPTDRDFLRIALRNLVTNALKFTPREGEIRLSAEFPEGTNQVHLHVQDNGVGMSTAQQTRLFQMQKRVRSRGTENEKGSGLGLILCRDILRHQGGDLLISSLEGKGTRATIALPHP